MMRLLLICSIGLFAPVAFGATQLEALRAGASAARSQVSSTRSAQLQNQAELNKLAGRIEELKAQAKGKLLPGSELDSALKRSQELSASLTDSAAALSSQQNALESANLALLSELSNELNRLRADFDRQTDRNVRTQLISKMRTLRSEREQVRAALPAAKLPALEAVKPSDDPEDLLEQADLVKDNEDKVRKQLQVLEKRIAEAKQERDLDNRVRQFLGDEALFDESDRRLRVTRETTTVPNSPAADPNGEAAPQAPARFTAGNNNFAESTAAVDKASTSPGTTGVPPPPGSLGGTGGTRGNADDFGFNSPAPQAGGANNNGPTTRSVSGADVRPNVGNRVAGGREEDDDLEDLEIQRAKLKGLADELKARASQLQKKAAQLK